MSLQWPLALLALVVVPVMMVQYRRARHPRGTAVSWSAASADQRGRHVPFALLLVAITLLVVAVARPHATIQLPRIEGTVILAFDNSTSMLAEDAEPTRIEAAQAFAQDFVDAQSSTVNVGVVSFSSGGVVLQQPTTEHQAVRDTIERLAPDGGTSIAQGLFTSLSAVIGEPIEVTQEAVDASDVTLLDIGYHAGAVVVLLSDGENRNSFEPIEVAQLAANAGIRIFAVGVGDTAGTTIQNEGFTVATALDVGHLTEIAEVTGGAYYPLAEGADVDAINDAVDLELTFRGEQSEVTGLVAAAGGLLLVISAALSVLWFGRVL